MKAFISIPVSPSQRWAEQEEEKKILAGVRSFDEIHALPSQSSAEPEEKKKNILHVPDFSSVYEFYVKGKEVVIPKPKPSSPSKSSAEPEELKRPCLADFSSREEFYLAYVKYHQRSKAVIPKPEPNPFSDRFHWHLKWPLGEEKKLDKPKPKPLTETTCVQNAENNLDKPKPKPKPYSSLTETCIQNAEKKPDKPKPKPKPYECNLFLSPLTCFQIAEEKEREARSLSKEMSGPCPADLHRGKYDKYYDEIVGGSEGFISFCDSTSMIYGSIRPCSVDSEHVQNAARVAIEKHNETMGANIKLKEIVRANSQIQDGMVFYLTLETLDGDETVFKEAKVQEYRDGRYEVSIFRNAIYHYRIQELESNLGGKADSSAEGGARRYQKSGSESQELDFFEAHKDEQWLKRKYHPTDLLKVFLRRKLHAQMIATDFLSDISRGISDLSPCATTYYCIVSADGGVKRGKYESSAAPKAHPVSCLPTRIHSDIGLASALVRKLDTEKGIEDNVLCNIKYYREFNHESMFQVLVIKCLITERVLYGTQLLDTLLTYLWRVHGVDYYGMIESDEPEGFRHVRPDSKDHGETSESGDEWKDKLVLFWSKRLIGPVDRWKLKLKGKVKGKLKGKLKGKPKGKLDAAAVEDSYRYKCVCKTYDETYGWMYGCVAHGCEELFHSAEFAHEHLKLKHPEVEMELITLFHEEVYRRNYKSYPDALRGSWWTEMPAIIGQLHLPLQSFVPPKENR